MVYPWQIEQWQQLWQAKQHGRLPHAVLLTGLAGTGKAHFAECFARAQLCQAHPKKDAQEASLCSEKRSKCPSCLLIQNRTHPNVFWVQPEKLGGTIKIDQIREASEFISHTSLQGEHRFVFIYPAHHMNIHAANALLKTLEEPAPGSMLWLISDQPQRLPATLLSRCQRMVFPRPPLETALAWLASQLPPDTAIPPALLLRLANGAPLAALKYVKNKHLDQRQAVFQTLCVLQPLPKAHSANSEAGCPVQAAAKIQEYDTILLLDWILTWALDVGKIQVGGGEETITNQDFKTQIVELSHHLRRPALLNYLAYLQNLHKQLMAGTNLNKPLLFENVLIRWMECA